MPRTRFDAISKPPDKLIFAIWGTMLAKNITMNELAAAAGMTRLTLYRRKQSPGDFTLTELGRIGRYLGIPVEELRQCIGY